MRRRRPFDWREECPLDLGRPYPAIVGKGRGQTLEEAKARKLRTRGRPQEASAA